jgi:hypothetical protein
MILADPLGFVEAHPQRVPKLGMGDTVLPVELDKVHLTGFSVEICSGSADLLLDVRW